MEWSLRTPAFSMITDYAEVRFAHPNLYVLYVLNPSPLREG
jgi:hypothetical protein